MHLITIDAKRLQLFIPALWNLSLPLRPVLKTRPFLFHSGIVWSLAWWQNKPKPMLLIDLITFLYSKLWATNALKHTFCVLMVISLFTCVLCIVSYLPWIQVHILLCYAVSPFQRTRSFVPLEKKYQIFIKVYVSWLRDVTFLFIAWRRQRWRHSSQEFVYTFIFTLVMITMLYMKLRWYWLLLSATYRCIEYIMLYMMFCITVPVILR